MATTLDDLLKILQLIKDGNETYETSAESMKVFATTMMDVMYQARKRDNQGKKWSDNDRYKHITAFSGKPEVWEE